MASGTMEELEALVAKSEERHRQECEQKIRELRSRLENMRTLLTAAGDLPRPTACKVHTLWGRSVIGGELAWRFGTRTVYVICYRDFMDNKVRFVVNTIEVDDNSDEAWRVFGKEYLFGNETVYTTVAEVARQQIDETRKWFEEAKDNSAKDTDEDSVEDAEDTPEEETTEEKPTEEKPMERAAKKETIIQRLKASEAHSEQQHQKACEARIARGRLLLNNMRQFLDSADSIRRSAECLMTGDYWHSKPQLKWKIGSRNIYLTCDCNYKEEVTFNVKTENTKCGMYKDETAELFDKTFEIGDNVHAAIVDCVQQQISNCA